MAASTPSGSATRNPESPRMSIRGIHIEDYLLLIVFWVLGIIVFAQFFSRYVFNSSLAWTEEIARYLLICVTFLGSATAVRKKAHLFIEAGYRVFPRALKILFSRLVDLIAVAFYGALAYLSVKIMPVMSRTWFTTVRIPMSALYMLVLIGFVVMTFHSIVFAWKNFRTGYIIGGTEAAQSKIID